MIIRSDSSAKTLRNYSAPLDAPGMEVEVLDNYTVSGGGVVTVVVDSDVIDTVHANHSAYNEPTLSVNLPHVDGVKFHALTPSVATIDGDGVVSRVSFGTAKFLVESGRVRILKEINISDTNPDETVSASGFVPGSLGEGVSQQIDTRLSGRNKAEHGPIFLSQNHTTREFLRNPDFWANDVDLTGISPSNSNANKRKGGVFPTPQHWLTTIHYAAPVGTKVYAVDNDSNTHERTVIARAFHPDANPNAWTPFPDLALYLLDAPFPASIKPCKVLPSNWHEYLVHYRGKSPSLGTDQNEIASVADTKGIYRSHITVLYNGVIYMGVPTDPTRLGFYIPKVSGDSGNPSGKLIKTGGVEFALETMWTGGGAGTGTLIPKFVADINQMIEDLDAAAGINTGHTVQTVDLSAYPNFSTGNYLIENGDLANGNASLWVEDGVSNAKPLYKLRGIGGDSTLGWTGATWEARDSEGTLIDSSADDVATPDLATFTTLSFEAP